MFSGLFGGGGSAKRAAAVEAGKQAEAAARIKQQQEETAATYQPYMEAGRGALTEYQRLAGGLEAPTAEMRDVALTMDPIVAQIREGKYQQSPGYEFRREEGRRALEQSAAAKGGLFSGATGRELERYGQGFATSEYDNYINRLRNQLTDVQTQMGGRQTALNAAYQNINAYQPLVSTGLQATSALGQLGAGAAGRGAGYVAGEGAALAGGMRQKAAQLQAGGDQWLNLGANLATGGMSGLAGGVRAAVMPQMQQSNMALAPINQGLPWQQQGASQGQQAALRTASSFA